MKNNFLLFLAIYAIFILAGCSTNNSIEEPVLDYTNPTNEIVEYWWFKNDPQYSDNQINYRKGNLVAFTGLLTDINVEEDGIILIFFQSKVGCKMDETEYFKSHPKPNTRIKVLGFLDRNTALNGRTYKVSLFTNCIVDEKYESSSFELNLIETDVYSLIGDKSLPLDDVIEKILKEYHCQVVTIIGVASFKYQGFRTGLSLFVNEDTRLNMDLEYFEISYLGGNSYRPIYNINEINDGDHISISAVYYKPNIFFAFSVNKIR